VSCCRPAPATGLPPENDNTHCWGDSCYFWYTSANYATAKQRCANTSSILFSPNSLEEQLEVGAAVGAVAMYAATCNHT
jgi:hypothetical protein